MDESLTSSAKNFTRRVSTCLALVGNNLGPYGRAMLSHVGKPIALEYTTTTSEWSEQTIRNLHFVSNRIWSSTWQIGFSRCVASQAKRQHVSLLSSQHASGDLLRQLLGTTAEILIMPRKCSGMEILKRINCEHAFLKLNRPPEQTTSGKLKQLCL